MDWLKVRWIPCSCAEQLGHLMGLEPPFLEAPAVTWRVSRCRCKAGHPRCRIPCAKRRDRSLGGGLRFPLDFPTFFISLSAFCREYKKQERGNSRLRVHATTCYTLLQVGTCSTGTKKWATHPSSSRHDAVVNPPSTKAPRFINHSLHTILILRNDSHTVGPQLRTPPWRDTLQTFICGPASGFPIPVRAHDGINAARNQG